MVYTRVCHSMCPGTLPRKFEIEGESTSHPFVDRCGSFATWVGVLPCVEDVSARASALRAVGQAQSQFICAWGGLLSLLGGRLCISGCPLLSDVCAVSEGCHAQGLMATLRSASLRTWHRFATWIACGVLWCVEISAGESASLPSADKCGIMGLRFATRVLGFRRASKMSHPQTAGAPIIGVQASV